MTEHKHRTEAEMKAAVPAEMQTMPEAIRAGECGTRRQAVVLLDSAEAPAYDAGDIERWKAGAKPFADCWEAVQIAHRQATGEAGAASLTHPSNFYGLQLLFAGEKPALFLPFDLERYAQCLVENGIQKQGGYFYVNESIQAVLDAHPEHFMHIRPATPDSVMRWMDAQHKTEANVQRGLLLGFPLQAVIDNERTYASPHRKILEKMMGPPRGQTGIFLPGSAEYDFCLRAFFGGAGQKISAASAMAFMEEQCGIHAEALGIGAADLPGIMSGVEFHLNINTVDLKGIQWAEHDPPSAESERKKTRVKAVLELPDFAAIPAPEYPKPPQ